MCDRRAGENKRQVDHKINQTKNVPEIHTQGKCRDYSSYAVMHGTTGTVRHFKNRFPQLKWTTVNDRNNAMIVATKKAAKNGNPMQIDKLEEQKKGRPSILFEDVTSDIKRYITTLHDAGGVVNT